MHGRLQRFIWDEMEPKNGPQQNGPGAMLSAGPRACGNASPLALLPKGGFGDRGASRSFKTSFVTE